MPRSLLYHFLHTNPSFIHTNEQKKDEIVDPIIFTDLVDNRDIISNYLKTHPDKSAIFKIWSDHNVDEDEIIELIEDIGKPEFLAEYVEFCCLSLGLAPNIFTDFKNRSDLISTYLGYYAYRSAIFRRWHKEWPIEFEIIKLIEGIDAPELLKEYIKFCCLNLGVAPSIFTDFESRSELISTYLKDYVYRSAIFKRWAEAGVDVFKIIALSKEINEPELLQDYVNFYCIKFGMGPKDYLFDRRFDTDSQNQLNTLFESGYPVNYQTLNQAFYSQNYQSVDLILTYATQDPSEKHVEDILRLAMELENPKIGELILKHIPLIASHCSETLLSTAVHNRQFWFVNWILSQEGSSFKPEAIKQLIQHAIRTYNLSIVKDLYEYLKEDKKKYLEVVNKTFFPPDRYHDKKFLVKNLTKLAIISPLPDLYEVVAFNPILAEFLPEALEISALLVRFPNQKFAQEVTKTSHIEAYLENSIQYARENLDFLNNLNPMKLTRDNLLNCIIKNRIFRFPSSKSLQADGYSDATIISVAGEGYGRKLINYKCERQSEHPNFTPIFSLNPQRELHRYSWCVRHLENLTFKDGLHQIPLSTSMIINTRYGLLDYFYSAEDEKKQLLTTRFATCTTFWYDWYHTPASTVIALQSYLEKLHKEILDFNLTDPGAKQAFLAKVAKGYWLIATLCETDRGTPHNAMLWLNIMFKHHKLPPPIPKIEHFFLDNTMLMLPVENAIDNWETFFEPTLDKVLPKEDLAKLLKQNGLLLRLCSDSTRQDMELAQIAIEQNSQTIEYVSHIATRQIE